VHKTLRECVCTLSYFKFQSVQHAPDGISNSKRSHSYVVTDYSSFFLLFFCSLQIIFDFIYCLSPFSPSVSAIFYNRRVLLEAEPSFKWNYRILPRITPFLLLLFQCNFLASYNFNYPLIRPLFFHRTEKVLKENNHQGFAQSTEIVFSHPEQRPIRFLISKFVFKSKMGPCTDHTSDGLRLSRIVY